MKKAIAYIVVGIAVLFAASIAFLVFSPTHDARIVRSESMKPALEMGDVAIMKSVSDVSQLQPGMIIGFVHEERSIAHRVVSIEEGGIQTKGDALEDVDPWLVPFSSVEGVLLFKIPYLGYVSRFARTPMGWMVLIVAPALLLIGYLVFDIFRRPAREKAAAKGTGDTPPRAGLARARRASPGAGGPRPSTVARSTTTTEGVKPRAPRGATRTDKPRKANLHWKGGETK